jgi:hypothetical protein
MWAMTPTWLCLTVFGTRRSQAHPLKGEMGRNRQKKLIQPPLPSPILLAPRPSERRMATTFGGRGDGLPGNASGRMAG